MLVADAAACGVAFERFGEHTADIPCHLSRGLGFAPDDLWKMIGGTCSSRHSTSDVLEPLPHNYSTRFGGYSDSSSALRVMSNVFVYSGAFKK